MRHHSRLVAAAAFAGLAATAASAQSNTFSGWLAPTHVMTREGQVAWADGVREATGGALDIEVIPGAAILPPLSTLQGVGDGVVMGGHITPAYHASEMPVNFVAGGVGGYIENPDFFILSAAYLDYAMHDPDSSAEWAKYNVLPLLTISTPVYHYICTKEVTSFSDMQGLKVRTPGGVWAAATEALGMIPVNLAFNELYTSMERGAVDCAAMDLANLTSGATVIDLAKSAVLVPISPAYNAAQVALNRDWWQARSDEERRAMLDVAAQAMAKAIVTYDQEVKSATEAGVAAGLKVVEPTEEMAAAQQAFSSAWYDSLVDDGKNRFGLENPETVLTAQKEYIDKWTGLLDGLDKSDAEGFAALLQEHLFSTVDESVYGMN